MKKQYNIFLVFAIILIGCTRSTIPYEEISSKTSEMIQSRVFLSGVENTHVFYELSVTDSFAVFLDFYNDTILQAYNYGENPTLRKILTKGQGPNEVIFPHISKAVPGKDKTNVIHLYDLNNLAIGIVDMNTKGIVGNYTPRRVPLLPFTININILESGKIIGIDVDHVNNSLFYVFNVETEEMKSVPYFPTFPKNKYRKDEVRFLYDGQLCVNEEKETIFFAMTQLNLIQIYDFNLNRKNTLQLGSQLKWPIEDPEIMNFPDSPQYFTSICGTKSYVYILYKGDEINSKIFVLTWEGELQRVIETDKELKRIAIDKKDRFLLGLHENSEGGSDVLKIEL